MDYQKVFEDHLPDSLYMNHYTLAKKFGGTPAEWRRFLKDNETFISQEITAITEANARQALNDLAAGNTNSSTVQAIKALLDRSEQLNKQNKDNTQFIMTFIPHPEPESITAYKNEVFDVPMPNYVQHGYGLYTKYDPDTNTLSFDTDRYTNDLAAGEVKKKDFKQHEWNEYVRTHFPIKDLQTLRIREER